ncbi:serine aminopeptidase domain-containing protein [Pseudomonas peli]|uniref:serine aminopeptidase domain-containing protein n=1 Tax=Pseudomonas peli TaxID=592361 RepID=UPI0024ACC75A|nr:alpha/beta hydrolase [Pseudomonas peli]
MAEHAGRYPRLGQALCEAGFAFCARRPARPRAHRRAWAARPVRPPSRLECQVVNDLASWPSTSASSTRARRSFLFGHSMGSYIAQAYLLHHSASLHGAILSGSNFQPAACTAWRG